jgi:hypothetical protein
VTEGANAGFPPAVVAAGVARESQCRDEVAWLCFRSAFGASKGPARELSERGREEGASGWSDAQDVATRTEHFYRSLLANHILPRWGDVSRWARSPG